MVIYILNCHLSKNIGKLLTQTELILPLQNGKANLRMMEMAHTWQKP